MTDCTRCGETVADDDARCPACNKRVKPLRARLHAAIPDPPRVRRPAKTRLGDLAPIAPTPSRVKRLANSDR